jgi:hypothetical protein
MYTFAWGLSYIEEKVIFQMLRVDQPNINILKNELR